MKHVLSISVKEKTILDLRDCLRNSDVFGNKYHFTEHAITEVLKDLERKYDRV